MREAPAPAPPTGTPDPDTYLRWVEQLPAPLQPEDMQSHVLAPLLSHVMAHPARYVDGHRRLRSHLLHLTMRWAEEHSPYYRALSRTPVDTLPPEVWAGYPTVDRVLVESHREAFIARNTQFGLASFTGGTTGAAPLLVERSTQEHRYLQNFFSILLSPALASGKPAPLGLQLASLVHGSTLEVPGYGYAFVVDGGRDDGYLRARWLLSREFDFEGFASRISQVQGPARDVYRLCRYLQEQGFEPGPGRFQSIVLYGMPLSLRRRGEMEAFFGTRVHDNYSLTEMFGGARYCHDCDAYHFDPFVFDEVLEVASSASVENGSGELTLTPLFPFTQRFTLIRYRTGDLVDVFPADCPQGTRAYRFRGRLRNVVVLDAERRLYVGTAEVAKILDGLEGVNREPSEFRVLADPSVSEWPRFRLESGSAPGTLHVAVEVRTGSGSPGAVREWCEGVRDAVVEGLPASMREWLHSGSRIEVTGHPPGTLVETSQHYL